LQPAERQVDGIWVAGVKTWTALAIALREQVLRVAYTRAVSFGKDDKMEVLYQYLAGDEVRQQVEPIVEAFTAMQQQIADNESRTPQRVREAASVHRRRKLTSQ
jgi:hypothetical protein